MKVSLYSLSNHERQETWNIMEGTLGDGRLIHLKEQTLGSPKKSLKDLTIQYPNIYQRITNIGIEL